MPVAPKTRKEQKSNEMGSPATPQAMRAGRARLPHTQAGSRCHTGRETSTGRRAGGIPPLSPGEIPCADPDPAPGVTIRAPSTLRTRGTAPEYRSVSVCPEVRAGGNRPKTGLPGWNRGPAGGQERTQNTDTLWGGRLPGSGRDGRARPAGAGGGARPRTKGALRPHLRKPEASARPEACRAQDDRSPGKSLLAIRATGLPTKRVRIRALFCREAASPSGPSPYLPEPIPLPVPDHASVTL